MFKVIREINPHKNQEIELVAQRMRQTLVDVLGEEKGSGLYSMDWLVDRVKWHLDPAQIRAVIFLSEASDGAITGHAIGRVEVDAQGIEFGWFSTIFVVKELRRSGIATALVQRMHEWFQELNLSKIIYNTAENNYPLIHLFEKHGYVITRRASEMVELTKKH